MLDKRSLKLLDIINGECKGDGYKIFAYLDLSLMMPDGLELSAEEIKASISTLKEREFISVKYEDEEQVCVCPLPKGRLIFENRLDEEIEKQVSARKYFLYSAVGALVGGVLSSVITFIIFIALRWI